MGGMPEPPLNPHSDPAENMLEALEACTLGRVIGSIDYMDASLDVVISWIVSHGDEIFLYEVLNAFTAEFPNGSAGRKFAIDFVFHNGHWLGTTAANVHRSKYDHLSEVEDEAVVTQLARKVMGITGLKVADDSATHQTNMMLVGRFFDARDYTDDFDLGSCPWEENKCQYHCHTELGLPCYADGEEE
jgi:hypothetical protein